MLSIIAGEVVERRTETQYIARIVSAAAGKKRNQYGATQSNKLTRRYAGHGWFTKERQQLALFAAIDLISCVPNDRAISQTA